ncbi:hypothetical protein [Mesorhizobium sp.]|nr:hypothetical protein [Mesorhizobium sp.]
MKQLIEGRGQSVQRSSMKIDTTQYLAIALAPVSVTLLNLA